MKKILTIALLCLGFTAFGQTYKYTFQLENVNTLAEASEINEVIMSTFNEADAMENLNNPTFNEETHVFKIYSDMDISQEQFRERLDARAITILSFTKERYVPGEMRGPSKVQSGEE